MYDSEIENPWNLLTGRFDLAFVITYLLLLFVLGWSYKLLTSEREQGTLRLLLSQPVRFGAVVAAKVAVRAVVLGVWCVVVPLLALLLLRQPLRDGAGLLSPTIVVHEGLAALAGNGTRRYQQFQAQVTAFHAEWRGFFEPRISQGLAITEADIAALPRFEWVEPASGALLSDTLERLLGLLAAAGLMALAAWRGLGRYPVARVAKSIRGALQLG